MYHFNNVGSPVAVTDSKGSVVETYNYTPYGELITGEYREDIPFLYNGQYGVVTDNNGLYYMRARYYNADIKRFINQDVLLGVLERISSLNRYAYVEGNPVSYLDPFGLEPVDTTAIHNILAVVGSAVGLISSVLPADAFVTSLSVAINIADIALYIYDLKNAIEEKDVLNIIGSACNIAKDVISIVSALIGFNVAEFYDKVVYFTGWNGANNVINDYIVTAEYMSNWLDFTNGSVLVETIASIVLDYMYIDLDRKYD